MRVIQYVSIFIIFFAPSFYAVGQTNGNSESIARLEAQVQSLLHTQEFLENHYCSLKVGTDQVGVEPKVIRSSGVVLAVADQLKGTYLDFESDSIGAEPLIRSMVAISDRVRTAHLFKFRVNESNSEVLVELKEASAVNQDDASYSPTEKWTIKLPLETRKLEISGKSDSNIPYLFRCEQLLVARETPVGSPIENSLFYLEFDIKHQNLMTDIFKTNNGCSFNYGAIAKLEMNQEVLNGSRDHIVGYSRTNASGEPIKVYDTMPKAKDVASDPSVDFLIKASIWYDDEFTATNVRFSVLTPTTTAHISGYIFSESIVASAIDDNLELKTGTIVANDGEELAYTCQ